MENSTTSLDIEISQRVIDLNEDTGLSTWELLVNGQYINWDHDASLCSIYLEADLNSGRYDEALLACLEEVAS